MPENKITAGQANITLANLLKGSKDKFFKYGDDIRGYQQRQSSRSGWGRGIGGLLGGLAISALTGGAATPWMIAAGAGVGSRVGSEIGERSAKGRKKYGTDLLFGRTKAKEANRELDRYYKDFNTQQNIHALYDAASGYMSAGSINKGVTGWNSAKEMGLGGWEGLFNTEGFQQQLQNNMASMAPKTGDAASLLKADTSSLGTFKGFDLGLGSGSANVDNSILSRLQSFNPQDYANTPLGKLLGRNDFDQGMPSLRRLSGLPYQPSFVTQPFGWGG
jgi:hypothetical protein